MMHFRTNRLLALLWLIISAAGQADEIKEDKSNPQAVIRAFYQAIASNQPDKAAALFSFSLLQLADESDIVAFREELKNSFAEEFDLLAHDYPKIELISIAQLKTLPDELRQYQATCHAYKIDDSISQAHGGVEWSLCNEKDGWKIMVLLSTE